MNNFSEDLKKVLLAGIGAVATTIEKSKDVVDELVKKGELTVEQGKALNEELKHNFAKKTEKSVDQISKDLENISPEDLEILKQIGYKIGLAFQIQDDILDVTSDAKTLGKNTGSDEANHKETYVTLLGIENSQKEVDLLFNEAQQLVYSLTLNHGLILEIIEKLWKRVR